MLGREGVVVMELIMGGRSSHSSAVAQSPGLAARLSGSRFKEEFRHHGELRSLMPCYTQWG